MKNYQENPEYAAKRVRLYYTKQFRPNRWHVIGPDGRPVYDDRPNGHIGDDKALVFYTHGAACECARNLSEYGEQEPEP